MSIEDAILEKVRALPPKQREEVLRFADSLSGQNQARAPLRSPLGLWAGLPIDISEVDLDELRCEMWKNFPREDI
jgi:hypothetical protein